MAIRDLPVKYVWVHRGGKTFAQRYHTLPRSVGAEYRPDLSSEFERFVVNSHQKNSQISWQQIEFASEMPARIYPLSAMHDPKQVISILQKEFGADYGMFPTRLFRDERFLKTTKYLPDLRDFVAGVYTYGTPEEAYDAIYTVGQHLLQSGEMVRDARDLWCAVVLEYGELDIFKNNLWLKPIRYYGLSYYPHLRASNTEMSFEYGVYVKLDFGRAARYARDWLPLVTEITARQIARQIVRGYDAEQKSQPVDWGAFDILEANESNKYAQLGHATHIAYALCIPAVESRMREVLESLGKPEVVKYYEQTVLPACQAHEQWKPDAGELYERLLSYGDS